MTINLKDIRTAVQNYLNTKVNVSISTVKPQTGTQIGQNEEFCFSITVTNASITNGGIALKNVRYRLWVEYPNVAKLIVPAAPLVARNGYYSDSTVLNAGTQVSDMVLFPPTEKNYLNVGDSDTIGTINYSPTAEIRGKSGTPSSGSTTNISFRVYAEVDLDHLFPKHEDSSSALRKITVLF